MNLHLAFGADCGRITSYSEVKARIVSRHTANVLANVSFEGRLGFYLWDGNLIRAFYDCGWDIKKNDTSVSCYKI